MWDEQVPPVLMLEFISPGTESEDLGRFAPRSPKRIEGKPPSKFDVYEKILQVPNYIVYDEATTALRYFRLIDGEYQLQPLPANNPLCWIPEIDLGIGLWQGEYRNNQQTWLRWCDRAGTFFPTDGERLRRSVQNFLDMGLSETQIAQALDLSVELIRDIQQERS
jgi:hypothetical protein